MKICYFGLLMFMFKISHAGTPSMNDTSLLYGIALILLGGLLGVPYGIKFIKNKIRSSKNKSDSSPNEIEQP